MWEAQRIFSVRTWFGCARTIGGCVPAGWTVRGADRAPADPRLRRAAGIGPVAAGSGRGDRRRAPSLLASLVRPRSASCSNGSAQKPPRSGALESTDSCTARGPPAVRHMDLVAAVDLVPQEDPLSGRDLRVLRALPRVDQVDVRVPKV